MRYYAFGETRLSTGTMFTDRLFTGQRQIAELGIYHYNARFYSPTLGRFLSADTLMSGFANPQNLNRFSYVVNNPLRYTDPSGHYPCIDFDENGQCIRDPDWTPADNWGNDSSGGDDGSGNDDNGDSDDDEGNSDATGPYIIKLSDDTVAIIMPPGSESTLQRPNWARRLGIGLGIAGFLFDVGEMATIFDVLPGDEDAAALADAGVTYLSSAFGGDSYIFERPDPSLPYMVTVNQDVIVTAGDAGLAGLVKIAGAATAGPVGYLVGEGTDVVTTGASLVYDGSRLFGNLNNYVSVGVAVTSTDQINSGDNLILIWPH